LNLRKREEVVGGWRSLHNEELRNLYASSNTVRVTKFRRMRWAGHVAHRGEMRNAYIFMKKPEGKRQCTRSRYRWEDNIRMEIGW
jgi:hypothetical protein